jgi:hypothetical protein
LLIVKFEVDILDDKCPYIIAESIGIQAALYTGEKHIQSKQVIHGSYLESQSTLDFLSENFGYNLIKVPQQLNGYLWLDSTFGNKFVQGLDQGISDAVYVSK